MKKTNVNSIPGISRTYGNAPAGAQAAVGTGVRGGHRSAPRDPEEALGDGDVDLVGQVGETP